MEIICSRDAVTKELRVLKWNQGLNGLEQILDDVVAGQGFERCAEQVNTDTTDNNSCPQEQVTESIARRETENSIETLPRDMLEMVHTVTGEFK